MAAGIGTQIPSKNKGHRKRSNQSADDNPAQTKRGRTQNSELAASPASDKPQCTIFQHLHSLEVESIRKRPLSGYMEEVQENINPVMRTNLVDWLVVGVAEKHQLGSDTLFLAVNYIDRFLSTRKLAANKLQLLGLTCMLVASKYEEKTRQLCVEEVCRIKDFTKDEVVQMEIEVLKTLEYEMGNPTTQTFLQMFASRAAAQGENENSVLSNSRFKSMCEYIAELSLTDYYGCVGYIPSIVAASVIFLARFRMQPGSHPWTPALQKHTGYEAFELKGCVLRLHNLLHTNEASAPAVRPKYMDRWLKNIPVMAPPTFIPFFLKMQIPY